MTGWVKLHRGIEENDLWLLETFTKGQAWVDLFLNANHKDGIMNVRGNIVPIKRGQIGWSELTMAKRWTWSKNRVRRFLKLLETKQQIKQEKLYKITTIITILNYNEYQSDTTDDTTERQQKDNRRYTNKNVKNVKNTTSVSNETNDDISSKELTYVSDLEETKRPKRATRQKPEDRKISMKLIDHLKQIKKMTVPDGRFQEDNIYPCASLVNKLKATLLVEKKEQTEEEILKLFDYIMNKLSDWHWERATSIKYISNNYYKIYEEIKNGQRK